MLASLKARAGALKAEVYAVYLAARDPRTPWYAKGLLLLVVAYSLSPIDLIPDFVPVLGYLDDLIIVPAGISLALKMIPAAVMQDARQRAQSASLDRRAGLIGAAIIIVIWILAIIVCASLVVKLAKSRAWIP